MFKLRATVDPSRVADWTCFCVMPDIAANDYDHGKEEELHHNVAMDAMADVIVANIDRYDLAQLCGGRTSHKVLQYLDKHHELLDKRCWSAISSSQCSASAHMLKRNVDNIDWSRLSARADTKTAFDLLRTHLDKINWEQLSGNSSPLAIDLLKEHPERINWASMMTSNGDWSSLLLRDPVAQIINFDLLFPNLTPFKLRLLREHMNHWSPPHVSSFDWDNVCRHNSSEAMALMADLPKYISWECLSYNRHPDAIALLAAHPAKICWRMLGHNRNPAAIDLMRQHVDNICWETLSANPCTEAIDLLCKHLDKVDWSSLSENQSQRAVDMLRANPDKIDWQTLSSNTSGYAMRLLAEQDVARINFRNLSGNHAPEAAEVLDRYPERVDHGNIVYTWNALAYDYAKMAASRSELNRDLLRTRLHPGNLKRFRDWGIV
jgi:hypothetical protein